MFINARFQLLPQLSFEAVRVSKFGANSLWQFCFRVEFSEDGSSKFKRFKAGELPQSLNQCGF
ncbi:hypothetical protein BOO31_18320 [Vibrio navarrensis]|nr:hypothetical protein [Vibrio navarrensis]